MCSGSAFDPFGNANVPLLLCGTSSVDVVVVGIEIVECVLGVVVGGVGDDDDVDDDVAPNCARSTECECE